MFTARLFGGIPAMSWPDNDIEPDVGFSNPASIRIMVVLPQPDGPSKAKNSRSKMSNVKSSMATKSPNRFVTFLNEISGSALGSAQGSKTVSTISNP